MARILVVDDEPDIREVVGGVLERAGHDVTAAEDGTSAATLQHEHRFDIIVSDLRMPGLNGIQLARAVRAGAHGDIPFLLVTAAPSTRDLSDAHQAGVTAHLDKPFGFAELRDKVALMLAVAQLRPQPAPLGPSGNRACRDGRESGLLRDQPASIVPIGSDASISP